MQTNKKEHEKLTDRALAVVAQLANALKSIPENKLEPLKASVSKFVR